ncbi:hypothetical protein AArc1_0140 [Natrarchaeobaculum sulfurireducens]|uniref:Uncharacterized protein n=1 Tax=Natrarchaeobaculum sulfurireducens TaxID=2044521 RepID=A0A346PAE7_9EURY|nr:hypothetical protein AArc1_0140 [Natrarchaeobaculum sulfurireducens]
MTETNGTTVVRFSHPDVLQRLAPRITGAHATDARRSTRISQAGLGVLSPWWPSSSTALEPDAARDRVLESVHSSSGVTLSVNVWMNAST